MVLYRDTSAEASKKYPLGFDIDEEEVEEIDQYADYEELEIDAADADVLEKFLPSAPREKKTLADLIMEKINEKNAAEGREAIEDEDELSPTVNPKVVEVYTKYVSQGLSDHGTRHHLTLFFSFHKGLVSC